jgi:hypothetical protein
VQPLFKEEHSYIPQEGCFLEATMKVNLKLFIRWFAIFCIFFILGSEGAFGQGLARISGTVTDPTGAAVPGATVVATRLATGEKNTVTSNGEGGYVFPSLAPAEYSVEVTANGFAGSLQKERRATGRSGCHGECDPKCR